MMVKVKVIRPILYGGVVREVGSKFWVRDTEADFLLKNGYVEVIEKRGIEIKDAEEKTKEDDIKVEKRESSKSKRKRKKKTE